jgi:hypothetical protein
MAKGKKVATELVLNALQGAALAKTASSMAPKTDTIAPGDYDVDLVVRVSGSIHKENDCEKRSTNCLLTKENLIFALSKVNDDTRNKILSSIVEAYHAGVDMEKACKEGELKEIAAMMVEIATVATTKKSSGRTLVDLTCVEVLKS